MTISCAFSVPLSPYSRVDQGVWTESERIRLLPHVSLLPMGLIDPT